MSARTLIFGEGGEIHGCWCCMWNDTHSMWFNSAVLVVFFGIVYVADLAQIKAEELQEDAQLFRSEVSSMRDVSVQFYDMWSWSSSL